MSSMIGQRINRAITRSGLSKSAIARTMGVRQGYVRRAARGDFNFGAEKLGDFADATGVSVDYLLGRTDEPAFVVQGKPIERKVSKREEVRNFIGDWFLELPKKTQGLLLVVAQSAAKTNAGEDLRTALLARSGKSESAGSSRRPRSKKKSARGKG